MPKITYLTHHQLIHTFLLQTQKSLTIICEAFGFEMMR